jgi:hypothetical protein
MEVKEEEIPVESRRLLLEVFESNQYHSKPVQKLVEIPASWKVTFAVQTAKGTDLSGRDVRIYENIGGKDHTRAVFTGVLSFRDASVRVFRRSASVQATASERRDEKGSTASSVSSIQHTWEVEEIPEKLEDDDTSF